MTTDKLAEKAILEVNHLRNQTNKYFLHENLKEDLIIFDEQPKPSSFPESVSSEFVLFEEIVELEKFIYIKRSRYTKDQLSKLSLSKLAQILEMYPSRQQTIRTALKIPKLFLSKLLKEIRSQ